MLEGRLNEINVQYFPGMQPTFEGWFGLLAGQQAAMALAYYSLFRPIHIVSLKRKIKSVVLKSLMTVCQFAFWVILEY